MRQRKDEFAELITLEMGKWLKRMGSQSSADILDYYADNGEAFLADKNLNPESGEAIIKIAQLGIIWCYGTFLLSDRTVCCQI
jgi:succinate-semialdehyde dehydrogenase/glutarate-semialdehyde dehydrogenase